MKKVIVLVSLVGCLLTGGCSFSANFTVAADKLAEEVSSILERNGVTPDIDCGDESIDLKDGNVVHCDLTVGDDPTTYDVTVTISDVSGTEYHIDARVADTPK
jgi:hypothetical protein